MENSMSDYFSRSKEYWKCAAGFPTIKEEVYPEHGLVQEFDLHHDKVVLEMGCGGGSDTISYMRRGNHVIACDIVESNLEKAEENVREADLPMSKVDFCHLECSWDIPIEDGSIDIVSSHGVLHHIAPQEYADKVVKELYRVCKKGGLFFCMLYSLELEKMLKPQIQHFLSQGMSYNEAAGSATDGPGTPYTRFYSEEQGVEYIERAGFKVEKYTLFNGNQFRTFKAVKQK
jgi:ubiquinone/menaquinone biosynthesis C-methylase UbiE